MKSITCFELNVLSLISKFFKLYNTVSCVNYNKWVLVPVSRMSSVSFNSSVLTVLPFFLLFLYIITDVEKKKRFVSCVLCYIWEKKKNLSLAFALILLLFLFMSRVVYKDKTIGNFKSTSETGYILNDNKKSVNTFVYTGC